ncbi:MAG: hypothetical protein JW736_04375 [Deltaproteobacteria bacterium]|nr:hypothetical protein [Deltaproteobacteria bacterium]
MMDDGTKPGPPTDGESEKIFDDFAVQYDSEAVSPVEDKAMTIGEGDMIHDLTDVVETPRATDIPDELRHQVVEKVARIAEVIAREMFPGIAERIVREEIDRLKQEMDESDL